MFILGAAAARLMLRNATIVELVPNNIKRFKNTTQDALDSGIPAGWATDQRLMSNAIDLHFNEDKTKFYTLASEVDLSKSTAFNRTDRVRILEHDVATGEVTKIDTTGSVPIEHDAELGVPFGWFVDPYTDDFWIVANVRGAHSPTIYLYCLRKLNGWKNHNPPLTVPNGYEKAPVYATADYIVWNARGYEDFNGPFTDDILWINRPATVGPITASKRTLSTGEVLTDNQHEMGHVAAGPLNGSVYSFWHRLWNTDNASLDSNAPTYKRYYAKVSPGGEYQVLSNLENIGFPAAAQQFVAATYHFYLAATNQMLFGLKSNALINGYQRFYFGYLDCVDDSITYIGEFPLWWSASIQPVVSSAQASYRLTNMKFYDCVRKRDNPNEHRWQHNEEQTHTWIQLGLVDISTNVSTIRWLKVAWDDILTIEKVVGPDVFGPYAAAVTQALLVTDSGDTLVDWDSGWIYRRASPDSISNSTIDDGLYTDPMANLPDQPELTGTYYFWNDTSDVFAQHWPVIRFRLEEQLTLAIKWEEDFRGGEIYSGTAIPTTIATIVANHETAAITLSSNVGSYYSLTDNGDGTAALSLIKTPTGAHPFVATATKGSETASLSVTPSIVTSFHKVIRFTNNTEENIASGMANNWTETGENIRSNALDIYLSKDRKKFYTLGSLVNWGVPAESNHFDRVRIIEHDIATGKASIIDCTGSYPIAHTAEEADWGYHGCPWGWFVDPYTEDIWIATDVAGIYGYDYMYVYCLRKANNWQNHNPALQIPKANNHPPIGASENHVIINPNGYLVTGPMTHELLWIDRPTVNGAPITFTLRTISSFEVDRDTAQSADLCCVGRNGVVYGTFLIQDNRIRAGADKHRPTYFAKVAPGGEWQLLTRLIDVGFPTWVDDKITTYLFNIYLGATDQVLFGARHGAFDTDPDGQKRFYFTYFDCATETFNPIGVFPLWWDANKDPLDEAQSASATYVLEWLKFYDCVEKASLRYQHRYVPNQNQPYTWISIRLKKISDNTKHHIWVKVAWSDILTFIKKVEPSAFGDLADRMNDAMTINEDYGGGQGDAIIDWETNDIYLAPKDLTGTYNFSDGLPSGSYWSDGMSESYNSPILRFNLERASGITVRLQWSEDAPNGMVGDHLPVSTVLATITTSLGGDTRWELTDPDGKLMLTDNGGGSASLSIKMPLDGSPETTHAFTIVAKKGWQAVSYNSSITVGQVPQNLTPPVIYIPW